MEPENMDEAKLLELLEIYMDLVEKQDVVIYHMSNVIRKQATEIRHMKNLNQFSDFQEPAGLMSDALDADEAVKEYETAKKNME